MIHNDRTDVKDLDATHTSATDDPATRSDDGESTSGEPAPVDRRSVMKLVGAGAAGTVLGIGATATAVAGAGSDSSPGYGESPFPRTADGWTDLGALEANRNDGDRDIYVSSSEGTDDGTYTKSNPLKSISAAMDKVRDGTADWVYLKRGDVWRIRGDGNVFGAVLEGAGRSPDAPLAVTAYGDADDRPTLELAGSRLVNSYGRPGDGTYYPRNAVVCGIDVYYYERDPANDEFEGPKNDGTGSLRHVSEKPMKNVLIEDCAIRFPGSVWGHAASRDSDLPLSENVEFRRNIVQSPWRPATTIDYTKAMGLFVTNTDGLLLEENVFYEVGKVSDPDGQDTIKNAGLNWLPHALYLGKNSGAKTTNTTFRGNFVLDCGHGYKGNGDGLLEDNYFDKDTIITHGASVSSVDSSPEGRSAYNVVVNKTYYNSNLPFSWHLLTSKDNGRVVDAYTVGGDSSVKNDVNTFEPLDPSGGSYSVGSTDASIDTGDVIGSADALYQSYVEGSNVRFDVPIEEGPYKIRLHFVEPTESSTGAREIDVKVNGTTFIEGLDVYAAAGKAQNTAVVEEIDPAALIDEDDPIGDPYEVYAEDGKISVELVGATGRAILSGIAFSGTGIGHTQVSDAFQHSWPNQDKVNEPTHTAENNIVANFDGARAGPGNGGAGFKNADKDWVNFEGYNIVYEQNDPDSGDATGSPTAGGYKTDNVSGEEDWVVDPDRDAATYNSEKLGGDESYRAFAERLLERGPGNATLGELNNPDWDAAETAYAVNDYVRAGFGRPPSPNGPGRCQSLPEAIDADGDGSIDDTEILDAISYWRDGTEVPGTCGETISDSQLLDLIERWRSS